MSEYADLILLSNCIFTATEEIPFSGYIAIKNDRILSIGKGLAPTELIGTNTKYLDYGNKTITPGFSDVHCFFTGYSVGFVGIDLSAATSQEDILNSIKEYAKGIPADKPILGHGWNSDTIQPNGTDLLDEAFSTRPVLLFAKGCETCWMNQAAINRYQFTPETCYPESYVRFLPDLLGDKDFIIPEFKRYIKMMNSKGITSIKEMGFDDFYGFTDILAELESENALTIRVNFMSQPVAEPFNLSYGKEMREKFKGEFVRFSGYNQMTDGSISELCGDLKKPYSCADTTCAQDIDWDLLNRHSITDLEFSDPTDLERMGKLGVIAEIYPQIQSIANRKDKLAMIEEKIGMDRGQYYWNRRKMADSNVLLSCGTDLPLLIDDIPESIYHAVGGYFPEGGEPFNKQNMLTIPELLTAWSAGGAYNLYQEKELGTLEKGKKADIVVFDGNLFETAIEEIRSRKVEVTFLNGRIVYSHE